MNNECKLYLWLILTVVFIVGYTKVINKFYKDNNDKIFMLILIIAVFLIPPLVWYSITIKSWIGFIYPEYIDAWINFYGALIGGALTLFGVWWTIVDQNKKREEDQKSRDKERREELSSQFKPILKVMMTTLDGRSPAYFNEVKNKSLIKIRIVNEGRGEALNITAEVFNEKLEYKILSVNDQILFEKEYLNIIDSSFKPGDTYKFDIKLNYSDPFGTEYLEIINLEYYIGIRAGDIRALQLINSKIIDYQEIQK